MTKRERSITARRAELFIRPGVPDKIQERLEDVQADLEDLKETDVLSSVSTNTWHRRVPVTFQSEAGPEDAVSRYDTFSTWAETHDCSLAPYFDTVTSKCGELIVFPVMCLAIYDDEELVAVFPHTDGDVHYSVDDGIDELIAAVEPEPTADLLHPIA